MTRGLKAACIMKSLVLAYVLTGILLLIIAFAVYKMNVSENIVNLCVIFVYVFSTFTGGFVLGKNMKERKFLWGAALGLIYVAIIALASIFAEGGVNIAAREFISALLICLGGGTLGGMLS